MYERPLRPDELMHYGVPGMKWGVRKDERKLKRLWGSYAGDMAKVARVQSRMGAHLARRRDTARRLEKANTARMKGNRLESKIRTAVAKTLDPLHTIRQHKVKHINKRMKKKMAKIASLTPDFTERYVSVGEDYANKLLDRLEKSHV